MPWIAPALAAALGGYAASRSKGTRYTRGTRRMVARRARYVATRYRKKSKRLSKRQWQARARRTVGVPRNYSTAKTAVGYNTTAVAKFNQQLHVASCVRISKGTGIDQRLRDTCVVSGVRIMFSVRNENGFNCFLNWAVIHPKDETTITASTADFYRDYNDDRSWNANAANKNGQEWSYASINTDKFDVLRRGKFLLGAAPDAASVVVRSNVKDSEKEMDIYVKLGRSFTFDNDMGSEPFENIYFCFWFAGPLQPAGTATGDGLTESTKIVTYFREPKTG